MRKKLLLLNEGKHHDAKPRYTRNGRAKDQLIAELQARVKELEDEIEQMHMDAAGESI